VIDICEIFTHWHAGRSKNEISVSLSLSRNTVRKYLAAAEAAGMVPGGPAVPQEEWARLARQWFPGAGGYAAAAGDVACKAPARMPTRTLPASSPVVRPMG